jgi:putative aldouronate transport system permease protein
MVRDRSFGRIAFLVLTYLVLAALFCLSVFPFLHVVAMSVSRGVSAMAGDVVFWPIGVNLDSYARLLAKPDVLRAVWVSVQRVVLGLAVNFLMIVLIAYPLSKESHQFRFRTLYAWVFVVTMLFSGGLIPWYLTIRATGMLDTIWALVVPQAVPVFSVMLVLNFFRGLPKALEEAALMDGAGHWTILWRIYIPLSTPALATVLLFSFVFHWNSWFDGLILMNTMSHYPLQSFMQTFVIQSNTQFFSAKDLLALKHASEITVKSALIVIGAVPVVLFFPLLQRFLAKGLVLGSVKG